MQETFLLSLEELRSFLQKYPEALGELLVDTVHGFKNIEAFGITSPDSEITRLEFSDGSFVECSPKHRLWDTRKNDWVEATDMVVGETIIQTETSETSLVRKETLPFREDLYDLQVAEVREFIVNGLRSHNSSMIEAIVYALFGKSFRQINKPLLVNSTNGKGCYVRLEFSIGHDKYMIERGIKPNIFIIKKNGKVVDQEAGSNDYQSQFENQVLKMNYRAFTQVIVLGSSTFVPFMELKAHERREVVETILDIAIFSEMNLVLKGRMSAWKESYTNVSRDIEALKQKIALQKDFLKKIKRNEEQERAAKREKMDKLKAQIRATNAQKQLLEADLRAEDKDAVHALLSKADQDRMELIRSVSMYEADIQNARKQISFFQQNNNCPVCQQGITHDHRDLMLQNVAARIEETQRLKEGVEEKVEEKTNSLGEIRARVAAIQQNLSQYEILKNTLNDLVAQARALDEEQKEQTFDIKAEEEKLEESITLLRARHQDLMDLNKKKEVYEIAHLLLKDNGIKKTIIKQYVPIINKLMNKYLQLLNFFVKFEIDEEFNESIKSKNREDFSYRSFSMGERARIDLALLFTWREIAKMKNSVSTNLLFFDEVFDSSLDGSGAEDLMTILGSLGPGVNTFIISHRGDHLSDKLRSHIHFEKANGFSRIAKTA